MLMFLMMQAFGISLIGMALGFFLFAWGDRKASTAGEVFGSIVIIISILNMLCTTFYAWKYWSEGDFTNAFPIQKMMQNQSMISGANMMHNTMMTKQTLQEGNKVPH